MFWFGAGMIGLCGMGLTGFTGCGLGISEDGFIGDGFIGDGLTGDGIEGDGTIGDGIGILEEGGFGISLGRLGCAGGIGGILRRFSTESYTSFRIN